MRYLSSNHKRCAESGVFEPILAVILLGLMTFLISLGINSLMVKRASRELRLRAWNVCANTNSKDQFMLHRRTMQVFQELVVSSFSRPVAPVGRVELTRIRLVMPTMPEVSAASRFDLESPAQWPASSWPSGAASFSGLGISSCATPLTPDCEFLGRDYRASDGDRSIPLTLLDDLQNSGNSIVCEFEGEVSVFWGPPKSIRAVYSFWRPVRGAFTEHDPQAPSRSTMPGIVVAVSTHLTTDAQDVRFQFPDAAAWSASNFYNPLTGFTSGVSGAPAVLAGDPNIALTASQSHRHIPSSLDVVSPERISADGQSFNWASSAGTAVDPTDYEEMRVACMNPAVLVRNAFLSSFLELASRHGQMRGSTEVLNISTQHRNVANNLDAASVINPPTIIVPYGADILRPNLDSSLSGGFQIPYVFYFSGDAANPPPAPFGPHKSGFVNPFSDSPEPAWRGHHALIAAQMRYCYHLYQSTNSAGNSDQVIDRFFPNNLHEGTFEPLDFAPVAALAKNSGGTRWDQNCPWGGLAPECNAGGGGDPGSGNRPGLAGLNGPELVSALGSTQSCPYLQVTPAGICAKPGYDSSDHVTNDLRPDYIGLLEYLAGGRGVRSPGLYPISSGLPDPFDLAHSPYIDPSPTRNKRQPVLIVTHQLPTSTEADALRAFLDTNANIFKFRAMVVVFIPTNADQLGNVDRLRHAFRADDSSYHNTVYTLDPASEGFGLTPTDFRNFWLELVQPSAGQEDRAIVWRALYVMSNLMTVAEQKL